MHCVHSVIEIRHFLTSELGSLDAKRPIAKALRAMRSACRKFLDTVGNRPEIIRNANHRDHWATWEFFPAIGELRAVFGIQVAQIAVAHDLDVESDLASIFPGAEDDGTPLGGLLD